MEQTHISYLPDTDGMVVFRQVNKRHKGGIRALDDINFCLKQGELAFLTGHSGAGKSSILRLISMQERATRGQVLINQRDVGRLGRNWIPHIRRGMGLIFQDHRLLMNKPVFDNVALPLVIAGLSYSDIRKRVAAALDKVELGSRSKSLPGMLSTGQQQRVGIARAIVHMPPLLLADEPTGNLDPELSANLMQLFLQLNELGMTILIASHDLELIRQLGHRVLILRSGQLTDDIPARKPIVSGAM